MKPSLCLKNSECSWNYLWMKEPINVCNEKTTAGDNMRTS